jgi:hypothetical protein
VYYCNTILIAVVILLILVLPDVLEIVLLVRGLHGQEARCVTIV